MCPEGEQMKTQAKAILKKMYYKNMAFLNQMFIPKAYRFEFNFMQNIRGETYSDISYKQAKLRSLTHQLDKTLTFNKIKNMDSMVNTIVKLSNDVRRDPNHDPAIMNWCNNVVKEYHSRTKDNAAINVEHIKFNSISEIVAETIEMHRNVANPDLEDILGADNWARNTARKVALKRSLC